MKVNPIGTYYQLVAKYNKYHRQLNKAIKDKSFWRYTVKKRQILVKRLRKLERKLQSLRPELGLKHAAAAMSLAAVLTAAPVSAADTAVEARPEVAERAEMPLMLSSSSVSLYAPIGTVVGSLSGGTTYDLQASGDTQDDHNSFFTVNASNELVVNANLHLAGSSTLRVYVEGTAFTITLADYPTTQAPFGAGQTSGLAGAPLTPLVDLDGDGDLDVISNYDGSGYTFYSNAFDSSQGYFASSSIGSNPSTAAALFDIDGDGDLEFAWQVSGNVQVVDPSLGTVAANTNPFSSFYALAIGDIDADGDMDLVAAGTNQFMVFDTSDPNMGSLANVSSAVLGFYPREVQLADMDADGDLDVVITTSEKVLVYRNLGGGSFDATGHTVVSGDNNYSSYYSDTRRNYYFNGATLGDIDGDGDVDVVSSQFGYQDLWQNSSGTSGLSFSRVAIGYYNAGDYSYNQYEGASLVDIDGDGDLDLVSFASFGDGIFKNNGSGAFTPSSDPISLPTGVLFADIDLDGDLDAVGSNAGGYIYLAQASADPTSLDLAPVANTFPRVGTVIGSLSAVDPDSPSVAFSLAAGAGSDDNHLFSIAGNKLLAAQDLTILARNTFDVRIQASDGGGGSLENTFTISISTHTGIGTLGSPQSFAGSSVTDAKFVDIDGDQDLDLILNSSTGAGSVVEFDSGTTSATTFNQFCSGTSTNLYSAQIAIGDLDGDSDLDLAVVSPNNTHDAPVLIGSGYTANGYGLGSGHVDVAIGDLDQDGEDEIIAIKANTTTIFERSGTASGSFQSLATFAFGGNELELADLDGDNDLDIFINDNTSYKIIENQGSNNFATSSTIHNVNFNCVGTHPALEFALGDFDGDGDVDVIMGPNHNNTYLFKLTNDGSANFSSQFLSVGFTAAASGVTDVDLFDFDGDGDLDITLANPGGDNYLLANCLSGAFFTLSSVSLGSNAFSIDFGDIDGDGDVDLLLGKVGNAEVLYNTLSDDPTDITIQLAQDPFPKVGQNIGLLTSVDSDGPGATFSLASGAGDDDNNLFKVSTGLGQGVLSIKEDLNPLARNSFNIRVRVVDGGGGSFEKALTVTIPLANPPITFDDTSNANTLANGNNRDIALADMDGDGELDFIVSDALGSKNYIIANDGSGNMGNLIASFGTIGYNVEALALSDFDDDGDLDIITAGPGNRIWEVESEYLATAGGNVISLSQSTFGTSGDDLAIGDLDGDGEKDILVPRGNFSGLRLYQNNNVSGTFTVGTSIGGSWNAVAIGDLDGDDDLEAIAIGASGLVRLTIDTSGINTTSIGTVTPGTGSSNAMDLELGDLDGDGDLDIVAVGPYYGRQILLNGGTGTFTSVAFPTSSVTISTTDMDLVDMDGDGDLDIIMANRHSPGNPNPILVNDGSAGFSFSPLSPFNGIAHTVDFGDLNSDGTVDMVFGGNGTDAVIHGSFSTAPSDIAIAGGDNLFEKEIGQVIRTFSVTDPNQGSGHTLNLVSGTGDTDNGLFTIQGNDLVLNADVRGFNAGTKTFNVRISATDDDSNTFEKSFVVQSPGAAPTPAPGSFLQASGTFGGDQQSYTTHTADFDGDGDLDIFVGGVESFLLLNDGCGSFTQSSIAIYGDQTIYDSQIADLDGDGDVDIVLLDGADYFTVLENDGSAGFTQSSLAYFEQAKKFQLGDLDGDGDIDIFAISDNGNLGAAYLNDGSQDFALGGASTFPQADELRLTDFDGDGDLDVVLAGENDGFVHVHYNDGGGIPYFTAAASFSSTTAVNTLALGDLDNDNDLDVVLGSANNGNQFFFKVSGSLSSTGSFGYSHVRGIGIGDMDNDGNLDIVNANFALNDNNVYGITSAGGPFVKGFDSFGQGSSYDVAIGDFDGDGDNDIFFANRYQDGLYFNEPIPPSEVYLSNSSIDPFKGFGLEHIQFTNNGAAGSMFAYELVAGNGDDHNGFFTIKDDKLLANSDFANANVAEAKIRVKVTDVTQSVSSTHELTVDVDLPGSGFGNFGVNPFNTTGNTFADNPPTTLELGDLNNDGNLDAVIGGDNALLIAFNAGGSLVDATPTASSGTMVFPATPGYIDDAALGDMDGDGDLDIVFKHRDGYNEALTIYYNDGFAGTFQYTSKTILSSATGAFDDARVAVADLDGDGDQDMVLAFDNVAYRFDNYGGGFSSNSFASVGGTINDVQIEDIDGDGDPDVVISAQGTYAYTYLNNGSGAFTVDETITINGNFFTLADIDSDGDLDLLSVSLAFNKFYAFDNDGSGSFTASAESIAVTNPYFLDVGDLDGDGDLDVVVTTGSSEQAVQLVNDGSGSFTSQAIIGFDSPRGVRVGDINDDGNQDLVGVGVTSATNLIGINASAPTDVTIGFIDPAETIDLSVPIGTHIGAFNVTDPGSSDHTVEFVAGDGDEHNPFFTLANGNLRINADLRRYTGLDEINLRVRATNEFGVAFDKTFVIAVSGAVNDPSPASFEATAQLSSADRLRDIAFGDIDDDGDKDLILATDGGGKVWLNDGSAGFADSGMSLGSSAVLKVTPVDVDGDADIDVAFTASTGVTIYQNDGSGSFSLLQLISNSSGYNDVKFGDFDGDGDVDMFVGRTYSPGPYSRIYTNNGDGTFQSAKLTSISGTITGTDFADMDNDGDPDPILFVYDSGSKFVALNNDMGTGSTIPVLESVALAQFSFGYDIADLDGDDDLDIITASTTDPRLVTNLGGTFTSASINIPANDFAIGDVDGDGDLDLFAQGYYNSNPSLSGDKVFINDGSAGFSSSITLGLLGSATLGASSSEGVLEDLDGDGDLDIIGFGTSYFRLDVWFNNNAPTISANSTTISEDVSNGATVFSSVGSDTDGDNLTFTIDNGNDDGVFAIEASTGKITISDNSSIDFETTESYTLTVSVTDGTANANADFTVNVSNVNESPTLDNESATVSEDATVGTSVVTMSGSDEDGNTLTYSISDGNTSGVFEIDEDTGEVTVADNSSLDFENTDSYTLTIDVTDGVETTSATLTIEVTDVNESPSLVDDSASIVENSANGTSVATLTGSDPENGTLTYSITSGNSDGAFEIDSSTGEVTVADGEVLDFETTDSYSLTIQVTDGTNTDTATLTITVEDEDEAPAISNDTASISESSVNGTSVATLSGSDPEGGTLSYSITDGNSDGAFDIDSSTGEVTVADAGALDFETTDSYTLTIEATDGTNTGTATLTVTITDEDEAPALVDENASVAENSGNGTVVTTLSANDPEGGTVAYNITGGNTDGVFAIDSSTGKVTVADASKLNFEATSSYSLTVEATDGTNTQTATLTVSVTDVNEAPTMADESAGIAENSAVGTAVATMVATDPDGTALTYSIIGGNDDGIFAIDASSGEVTVADVTNLDFEITNKYELDIQASDGTNATTAQLVVSISGADEAPTIADATASIVENSGNDTAVATMTATDPEGASLTYSITAGNTGNAFAIDSSTGAVTVADATALDFETNPTFAITIEVSDGTNNSTAVLTVTVTDVDEAPALADVTFSVDENSDNGTVVGTVTGTDPEGGSVTHSITGGNDAGVFAISDAGEITVADNTALDFETTQNFDLEITASDGTNSSTATVTIEVNDVDDGETVLFSVDGTVTNSAGSPVSGGVVSIIDITDFSNATSTTISSEGRFDITDVPSGEYTLLAIPTDGSLVPTYLGGQSPVLNPSATFETINVRGNVTGVAIAVADKPTSAIDGITGSAEIVFQAIATAGRSKIVEGRVANGDPVPNTLVVLYDANGEFVASATTDADGFVTFSELPDGEYTLTVEIPGVGRQSIDLSVEEGSETEVTGMIGTDGIDLAIEEPLSASIEDESIVNVYPNPVVEVLNIEISNDYRGQVRLQILGLDGKLVVDEALTKNAKVLTISRELTLKAGIYMANIKLGTKTITKRLVKN